MSDQAMTREEVEAVCNELPLLLSLDSRKARAEQLANADAALREELACEQVERQAWNDVATHHLASMHRLREELAQVKQRLAATTQTITLQSLTLTQAQTELTQVKAELEEYRSIAEKIGAEKAVSQLAQAQAELAQGKRDNEELRIAATSLQQSLAKAARHHDDQQREHIRFKLECDSFRSRLFQAKQRIAELEEQLEAQAWKISPAMAQAKIDELHAKIAELEAKP
jgi:chromosome segregation ATPase